MQRARPDLRILAVAAVALLVDRLTKEAALRFLPLGRTVWILGHTFGLTRIVNQGAAFGLLPREMWLFTVVAAGVIGAVLLMPRQERLAASVGYGLLAGGASGNLWDRLAYGAVVDFLNLRFWPGIFNAADVFVVVGVCLILISLLRR